MEHHETDADRWVDERLSALGPPGSWQPDAPAALAKLRLREAPPRHRWWLWATVSAAAAASVCVAVLLISTPPACANPRGCIAVPAAAVKTAGGQPDFKQSGSSAAPVTCELFSDFECPHCAAFYLDTLPRLSAEYIDTGKVRLLRRDAPVARHGHARMAALYADAAGEAGFYRPVAEKLYRTQAVWSANGDVESQVAAVVPAAAMEKVRAQVRNGSAADRMVTADETAARERHVDRTPMLICNGHTIGPNLSFPQIEAQIDPLVGQR
ncbi:MAG TPA: thioredoxin domain-containing protein [Bryobacteraceae bacterium]|jgi:protein-disulfide isomerase|nr:thioredoxin domain-containing protein [Bryobacteraceae bacterium]